ncbi:MAG: DegT/DnrJ/EryC1/StrS family aminotransferase [Deltaproteobacteria bacterium]|jgi:dTDP-4-amino-4,6-dideoxygalactose transaminase|nr:DegT/DnrJ/EryC1/StrS family aminotransferase [Deltaproteobacteria bacterium]
MIPQSNPLAGFQERPEAFLEAARRVLESGCYIFGDEVSGFEAEFAAFVGARHAIGCASGTDAIELMLRGLGIGTGDAVFLPSLTAVASAAAIARAGATPWFADVDPTRLTVSPASLASSLRLCRDTRPDLEPRAVLAVHLYGSPCDLPALREFTASSGLVLLEDCAQSHGARLGGRMTGSFGEAAAFSFYPTKNLGAFGDGGMVATSDGDLAGRLRLLRQYGWRERDRSEAVGMNSRLDPLQAAFLRVKLPRLEGDNARRAALAEGYRSLLSREAGRFPLLLPELPPGCSPVYHQFVVRTARRDGLKAFCESNGVATAIHYPVPVHLQPAYRGREAFPREPGGLRFSEQAAGEVLSLPMFPQMTAGALEKVCSVVARWVDSQ